MATNFWVRALQDSEFTHLFNLDNAALEKMDVARMLVDKKPGFPCRVSLADAEIGEEVILVSYKYHNTHSPYMAKGPVFVRKKAKTAEFEMNELPVMLYQRLLSLRGYDKNGMMNEAAVVEGSVLREQLHKIFENPAVSYIHIHNAKPGCYNCVVERC
ncbi:MAG: DUF1203 domain-containing protein [Rhizobacter sp.]|nr:DUF1203 domain-containing protein [Ferruginibacter sp.]